MASTISTPQASTRLLPWSARAWFLAALAGQWLFATYIAWTLVRPLMGADAASVDGTRLITGYIQGDTAGNAMLLGHVLAAAIINLVGLLQLVPAIRRSYPSWHRWAGRTFMVLSLLAAISGFYMVWVRGSRLSDVSAAAITLNGVLILLAVTMAWRLAMQRRFAEHRRWAIRAFLLVSGVWTLRLGLMAWVIINQGPNGNTERLDGTFDSIWVFGCYLIPLAIAELYFRAEKGGRAMQFTAAGVLALSAAFTLLGTFGAFTFMWLPHF
ncbi:DUF2306 domain-containing protein [Thermomonas sp.]|uniref:DUF2306 domain-containing protein n=1 Tax=Thermomonas sp. TaxID=1971895 RepID=UPI002487946F|nr:DUF2306 domain-containing protein [Thermomonas sp.]MDI1252686.1 DUF2306 domain-containing protein [Thermomonas sp.]